MSAHPSLRPSPIAGSWYPGTPQALAKAVDEYIDRAELPELLGELVAVIAPHAGYVYSGPVAGYSFAAVRAAGGKYDLAVVISPMHQPYPQPLLTTSHDAYRTPLGDVQIERSCLADLDSGLRSRLGYGLTAVAGDREHSLEIELPFLQRTLGNNFQLLPVMIRSQSPGPAQVLGEVLADVIKNKKAILVASTDLSHFFDQHTARSLDTQMLQCFESFVPEAIFQLEDSGKGQACGHAAVAAVLWAARALGADVVKTLHYATSGDVTGDNSSVVGYGSCAVLRTKPSP